MLAPRTLATFEQAIRDSIGKPRYELWFQGNTKLVLEEETLEIGVPNRFYREWLESHFQEEIRVAAHKAFGNPMSIRFRIDPNLFRRIHTAEPREGNAIPTAAAEVSSTTISTEFCPSRGSQGSFTNFDAGASPPLPAPVKPSRYSLSRFVAGSPNRVAHSAALTIVDNPKSAYSPLFIHGAVGMGKTHLLKGIEEGLKIRHRNLKVLAISCEQFTNEFVEAMRTSKLAAFRKRMRHLDVLLVDDVQFLSNKRATQEEFFHTLNALETRGAKVVLSCDVHPRRLAKIGEELKSRFVAGMVAKIDPPTREMRRQLIRDKAAQRSLELRGSVVDFLAEKLCANICEIEGAINYLEHYSETYSKTHSTPLDAATAQIALAEVLRHAVPVLRVPEVKRKFCEIFEINPRILSEKSRSRAVAHPRMMLLYLARRYTSATYCEIGEHVGGLNHSTVIAAEKRVKQELKQDGEIVLGDRPWKVRDAIEAFERELGRAHS
ncbi:MAG: chromosomal replication initiator protein DnaA [Planctomycetota bacterium]